MILASFFSSFFKAIAGKPPVGQNYNQAFDGLGIITIAITIVLCCLFYFLFGRMRNKIWFKLSHWIITLSINSSLNFSMAIMQAKWNVAGFVMTGGYPFKVALINAILSAVLFFLLSIIIKRWSIYSKYVPF